MSRLGSKVLAGASLVLMGTVAHGLTRFLLNWTAGRSLGPEEFGRLALCLAIAQFAALLWPTTLGVATSKFVAQESEKGGPDSVIRYLRRMAVVSAAGTAAVAGVGWAFMGDGTWLGVLATVSVCLLYGLYHFTRGALMGKTQFARVTLLEFLLAAVCLAAAGVVALRLNHSLAFAACLALGFAVFSVAGFSRTTGSADLPAPLRREIRSYVLIGTIGTVASSGFLQLSVVAASHWGGATGAGYYGAALAVATPASIFAVSLGAALMPALSAAGAKGDHRAVGAVTDRATRGINLLAVSVFGTIVISADHFTAIVWGDEFRDSAPVLRILLIAVMLTSCAVPCVTRLSSSSPRALADATRISIGGVVVAAVCWVPLGESLGVEGIAWGYLVGATLTAGTLFATCWRRDSQRWLFLALRTFGATLLLVLLAFTRPSLSLPEAALASAVFVLAYGALSFADRKRSAPAQTLAD